MCPSTHGSSIPFCDLTSSHPSYKASSQFSSPFPTLPHRACNRTQAESPQFSGLSIPFNDLIIPSKTKVPRVTRVRDVGVSSRYHASQPTASPSSLLSSIRQPASGIERKRSASTQHNRELLRLVLTNTPPRNAPLPTHPIYDDNAHPPIPIQECQDLIDNSVRQTLPTPQDTLQILSLSDDPHPSPEAGKKAQWTQHRNAPNLPQLTLPKEVSAAPTHPAKHKTSLDTETYLGGDIKTSSIVVSSPEPWPSFQPTVHAQPHFKPRRPSIPLRLFPSSPTSSEASSRSGYPETASPAISTFHPSLLLQHQVSVFEDDDEKLGLMDYFKLGLPRKARRSQRKRGCNWKRIFFWNCAGGESGKNTSKA
jgi:hypothetical protein